MSGYDVARSYKRALRRIWQAPIGQIYPTLRAMEREGVLEVDIEIQEDRPNRKVYRLGRQGVEAFQEWIASPPELPVVHHEFIHTLFLLDHVPAEQRQALIEDYAKRCWAWVGDLVNADKRLRSALDGPYGESVYYQLLAIAHLRNVIEAEARSAEVIAQQYLPNGVRRRTRARIGEAGQLNRPDIFGGLSVSPQMQARGSEAG